MVACSHAAVVMRARAGLQNLHLKPEVAGAEKAERITSRDNEWMTMLMPLYYKAGRGPHARMRMRNGFCVLLACLLLVFKAGFVERCVILENLARSFVVIPGSNGMWMSRYNAESAPISSIEPTDATLL